MPYEEPINPMTQPNPEIPELIALEARLNNAYQKLKHLAGLDEEMTFKLSLDFDDPTDYEIEKGAQRIDDQTKQEILTRIQNEGLASMLSVNTPTTVGLRVSVGEIEIDDCIYAFKGIDLEKTDFEIGMDVGRYIYQYVNPEVYRMFKMNFDYRVSESGEDMTPYREALDLTEIMINLFGYAYQMMHESLEKDAITHAKDMMKECENYEEDANQEWDESNKEFVRAFINFKKESSKQDVVYTQTADKVYQKKGHAAITDLIHLNAEEVIDYIDTILEDE